MSQEVLRALKACAAAIVAAGTLAACAHKPPEPVVQGELIQSTATVEAINPSTRMVALRNADGRQSTVLVGPEVRNLDQVKVGDRVVVSFFQGIAAEVKPKGAAAQDVEEETEAVRSAPGERPAGAVGSTVRTTVKIESVDTSFDTVTFRRPDGLVRTLAVESPEGREFIDRLRPGDEVDITYTEAVAVEVKPAG